MAPMSRWPTTVLALHRLDPVALQHLSRVVLFDRHQA